MAFWLWALPNKREDWIIFLAGGVIFVVFLLWAIRTGEIDLFEDVWNAIFWLGFALFWGIIAISILKWIFEKVSKFFTHNK